MIDRVTYEALYILTVINGFFLMAQAVHRVVTLGHKNTYTVFGFIISVVLFFLLGMLSFAFGVAALIVTHISPQFEKFDVMIALLK